MPSDRSRSEVAHGDWVFVDDHTFVGMGVRAETTAGDVVDGTIAAIWTYEGEPRRLDVAHDDGLLNIDRDRVEVSG